MAAEEALSMAEQPPQSNQPGKKRWIVWVVWLIIVIILALLVLLFTCNRDSKTSNTNETPLKTGPATKALPDRSGEGSGPVARWLFNGDGQDATGNGHTATALGGATFDGKLDGVNDGFTVANSPKLNPTNAITISAWWDAVDFSGSGNNGLVDKGFTSHVPPYYQYHLGVTGNKYGGGSRGSHFDFWVALDGKTTQAQFTPWTPGKRYHLVGTYDGHEVRLYIDGQLAQATPASGSMTDYGKDIAIATYTNFQSESSYFLPGKIDDIAIWDRALAAAEVKALYDAGPK